MPGQAIVTIRGKQWSVAVANIYAELTSGLSGVGSISQQTGVLFDLGYDQKYIKINMTQMLFPLDIIFINSTQGVVGVLHNVQPSEEASLQNEALPGARCFLEINAGEAEGIEVGDNVAIEGYAQPTEFVLPSYMIYIMFFLMMTTMMFKVLSSPQKPPTKIAQIGVKTREEELQAKKITLESIGRNIAKEAGGGIEFGRLDEDWQYATPRYWFRDSRGNEIVARDLEELKWKLSILQPQLLPQTENGFKSGEIVKYKGERVRVLEQIGDWVNIFIPSRQELVWVKPGKLEKIEGKFGSIVEKQIKVADARGMAPGELEYLADSPDFLAYTIEDIGYRDKLDSAFQEAIKRARGA